MRRRCLTTILTWLLLIAAASNARAGRWVADLFAASHPCDRTARAGQPWCVAPWAKCSDEPRDWGYYAGGGAAKHGEVRCWHEGTWGWDYHPRGGRVMLHWWHGRHQGGEGQYEPDEKNAPLECN